MGRTDTKRAPTFPKVDFDGRTKPGTDANTIGRYAVHFHVLTGGQSHVPPHVVRSIWNDEPGDAVVIIVSNRLQDPQGDAETVPDFWPE